MYKRQVLTREKNINDKIDAILTNKWLGIPIFAAVMWLVFQISQVWVGPYIADALVAWLETFQDVYKRQGYWHPPASPPTGLSSWKKK